MDWIYQAEVISIYDGDTITVDIDMGMKVWQRRVHVRLAGINAPEMIGITKPQGTISRDALRILLPIGSQVKIVSHQFEKYGRLLATVYTDQEINVNQYMLNNSFAIPM